MRFLYKAAGGLIILCIYIYINLYDITVYVYQLACLLAGLFACPGPGMLPCYSRVSWLTWLQPAQVTGCHGQVRFRNFLRLAALRWRHPKCVCKLVQNGFADVCKLGLKSVQIGFVSRVVLAVCQSREMLIDRDQ